MSVPNAVKKQEEEALKLLQQESGNTDEGKPLPTPEHDPQPEPQGEDWEHKYKTLKGKFDATARQLTELRSTVTQLQEASKGQSALDGEKAELARLKEQNQQLLAQLQAHQAQPQEQDIELDPSLVDEYGEEFARAVANQANKAAAALEAKFSSRLQNTEQTFNSISNNQKQTTLAAKLGAEGIDFNQVDSSQAFHEFLAGNDVFSGMQRQQLLIQAFNSNDLERCANFYREFAQQNANAQQPFEQNPLSQHARPNTVAQPDNVGQASVWTDAQIEALYRDHREGRISDEQFKQYEQDLFNSIGG